MIQKLAAGDDKRHSKHCMSRTETWLFAVPNMCSMVFKNECQIFSDVIGNELVKFRPAFRVTFSQYEG